MLSCWYERATKNSWGSMRLENDKWWGFRVQKRVCFVFSCCRSQPIFFLVYYPMMMTMILSCPATVDVASHNSHCSQPHIYLCKNGVLEHVGERTEQSELAMVEKCERRQKIINFTYSWNRPDDNRQRRHNNIY